MASATPALLEVASTTTPAWRDEAAALAASIMPSRPVLTLRPVHLQLDQDVRRDPRVIRPNRTTGVAPIRSVTESTTLARSGCSA
jgi:hypothetical protein